MIPEAYQKSTRHRVLWATMCFLSEWDATPSLCKGRRDYDLVKSAAKTTIGRRQAVWEHKAQDKLKVYFREEHEQVMAWWSRTHGKAGLPSLIRELEPDLQSTLTGIYMLTGTEAERWSRRHLPLAKAKKRPRDPFNQPMEEFLREQAAEKIKDISATTAEKIRVVLQRGVAEGRSIEEQADALDDLYLDDMIPNRSMVIARTEIANAAGFASHFAAMSSGVPMTKEWMDMGDEFVRDSHADANGQEVPAEEPFIVDGEELMWPGDGSRGASPENIIQCRCAVLWHSE